MPIAKLSPGSVLVCTMAGGILCCAACRQDRTASRYQTVPLVQGTRSFGLPMAGIAVDADRRDVYAIVGPKKHRAASDFIILWKAGDGASYCATLSGESKDLNSICELLPKGRRRTLYDRSRDARAAADAQEEIPTARVDEAVQSIIEGLPTDSVFYERE